ncbi:xanthine dehydrogenase family protein molybdopterin-binding subunit [Leeuwenhoekiella sp. A16]|uniref:xanthine dehydrogenase family protein molybdopterin-binding subunit n=1 Tax=unclassified Leeuwenhoekiella TaxID=2615029 RepID=UPI003A80E559
MSTTDYIGQSMPRVDGPLKVSGKAPYAAEYRPKGLLYGYVVQSSIANGKITAINTEEAENLDGVVKVFTHLNLPDYINDNSDYSDPLAPPGKPFRPLFNDNILYNGQPIALVIAETFELARYAAGLVDIDYSEEKFTATIQENLANATHEDVEEPPEPRGDADSAFAKAKHQIEVEYQQPRHYHNPMEPHATTAIWNSDGSLTIYDKIQGVANSKGYVCGVFGFDEDKVQVISPFVGGAFGSGLRPQYQLFLATLAATELKAAVQVSLTRRQMFSFGHRPANIHRLKLAADESGKLMSIQHTSLGETSTFEKYSEPVVDWSGLLYECENVKLDYQLIPVQAYTPLDMRAPGGTSGVYALECAIDEIAEKAGIDPLEFRLLNYAERDQNEDKPFTSKELRECYKQCADKFNWKERNPKPRSVKKGNNLVGYGMATGVWEAMQKESSAKAEFDADGKLTVSTATADIGTGTYTVMSQIAAKYFGIDMDEVTFKLGDTKLPESPIEGGSWTVSSVGSAVKNACEALREQIFALAKAHDDRFKDLKIDDNTFKNGEINLKNGDSLRYVDVLKLAQKRSISVTNKEKPKDEREDYSAYAHCCIMVEVHVDEDLGVIRIPRVLNASAAGRIINPKTAESQLLGATVWGIGMALEEEGMVDKNFGRIMNANLAEYHIPVNADIKDIDVIFVDEKDEIVNPLGAKGVGELAMVGVAAAVSNAVYNATGKRVRELPIKLDHLL